MQLVLAVALLALLSVSSYAKPASLGPLCLNMVNCFVDPCRVSKCDAIPKAECVSNYCGGCNAFWYLDGNRVECSAPLSAPIVKAEKKCLTVNCFVNPCAFAKCNSSPAARCRPNYCGGCNADFYDAENQLVQCD